MSEELKITRIEDIHNTKGKNVALDSVVINYLDRIARKDEKGQREESYSQELKRLLKIKE